MYTTFGYIDNSPSMFYGNGISLLLSTFQIGQKIHYKRLKDGLTVDDENLIE
jgi:hypothetical protein